ncbi:MAG: hypothetical protein JSU68_04975 [Phycisphaerales bacterium]|nr:MAG: hypothetical protein JSU68_04975 [Phycisphaerales bacterium]
MKTITSAMCSRRTACLVPRVLPSRLLTWVPVVAFLSVSSPALATDYRVSGTCADYSTMGHAEVDYSKGLGTPFVDISECAGETGCCCTDNCADCADVDIGGQDCEPVDCVGHCVECCHHIGDEDCKHQSCCSIDGDPDICCIRGAPACDVKVTRATVRRGCSCFAQGQYVATICDDGIAGMECPPAGQRLEATLSVGYLPDDDLSVADLVDMHNGLLSVYVEFEGGGVVAAPISNDGPKEHPLYPVAALSFWGMIALAVLLATGGIVLMRQHRPQPA